MLLMQHKTRGGYEGRLRRAARSQYVCNAGRRACAACGATDLELIAGDDEGYVRFCSECASVADPLDPYFDVGGEG